MSDWEDVAIGAPASKGPTEITIGLSNNDDSGWEDVAIGPNAPTSDLGAIRNSAVRGFGSMLGLADLVVGKPLQWAGLQTPSFQQDYERLATDIGLLDNTKPASQIGRFAENVSENAAAAAPFGPIAMLGAGILGGTGGYLGESVGGSTGRAVGSFFGGISPAAINKLGIAKKVGEQLGPTLSRVIGIRSIVGDEPIKAAVGRAIQKTSSSPDDLVPALSKQADPTDLTPIQQQLRANTPTAELIGDTGLSRATDAVENLYSNAGFKDLAENRAAIRAGEAIGDFDPSVNQITRSQQLAEGIGESAEAVSDVAKASWNALDKKALIDTRLGGLDDALNASIKEITIEGAQPLSKEASGLLARFRNIQNATDEGITNFEALQNLRSRVLETVRATSKGLTPEDRETFAFAKGLEEHIRKIIDVNADSGRLSADFVDNWKQARELTKFEYETFGKTKGLKDLAIKGVTPEGDKLIRNALSTPESTKAFIEAGKAGGVDVKPIIKQTLQAELESLPQSKWADAIAKRKQQWDLVTTKKEREALQTVLDDIAKQVDFNKAATTSGSATNPRGNVQKQLMAEKGIARLGSGSELSAIAQGAGTLGAAGVGASYGSDLGERVLGTPGYILGGATGGLLGAVLGKGFKNITEEASTTFDNLLVQALKDPKKAQEMLKAAEPSNFSQNLKKVLKEAAISSGAKTIGGAFTDSASKVIAPKITAGGDMPKQKEDKSSASIPSPIPDPIVAKNPKLSRVANRLADAGLDLSALDALDIAQIRAESSGVVNIEGPKTRFGRAKGLMQLLDSTGKEWHKKLGLEGEYDPFNAEQNVTIGRAYRRFLEDRYDGDVRLALAAYNWGLGNLDRALARTKSGSFEEVVSKLPSETRNYVAKIMGDITKMVEA